MGEAPAPSALPGAGPRREGHPPGHSPAARSARQYRSHVDPKGGSSLAAGVLAGPRLGLAASGRAPAAAPVRVAFVTFAEAFRSDGPTSSTSSS